MMEDGRKVARKSLGESQPFEAILGSIETVAPRHSSVVLLGETGVGKEMVARKIHAQSDRREGPFVPVDCAALSGTIFESQLFGHVKGAFTSAVHDTLGFFRAAEGGTIFLDEIGEIEPDLQAKLLRVLQESRGTPVGSTESMPVNIRVICATNRDLKQMVRKGTFRADLYFRINVFKIEIPPLRERKKDILILANHFLAQQAELYHESVKKLSPETIRILLDYDWPGNVRELANVMEHIHIASDELVIEPHFLPTDVLNRDLELPLEDDSFMSFEDLQKKLVIRALQKTKGRKMATARLLKIDHRKLDRLVEDFNLEPTWR
jgi:transcriptional regulator with PAS, ATPase and Fis domain